MPSTEESTPLIRAYGLWWVRDAIDWKKKKKELPGRRMQSKGAPRDPEAKDFRVEVWNQRGVYALYSESKLVYVGLADSEEGLGDRLLAHNNKPRLSGRWDSFSWFGINGFDANNQTKTLDTIRATPKELIRTLELILILAADPTMNRASGKFTGAERINQAEMIVQPTNAELKTLLEQLLIK